MVAEDYHQHLAVGIGPSRWLHAVTLHYEKEGSSHDLKGGARAMKRRVLPAFSAVLSIPTPQKLGSKRCRVPNLAKDKRIDMLVLTFPEISVYSWTTTSYMSMV